MARFDVDSFLATLPERGVPPAQVTLYREAVEGLLAGSADGGFDAATLDRVLAIEGLRGASERRLANLQLVGDQMVAFEQRKAETMLGFGAPVRPAAAVRAPLVVWADGSGAASAAAPERPAVTASAAAASAVVAAASAPVVAPAAAMASAVVAAASAPAVAPAAARLSPEPISLELAVELPRRSPASAATRAPAVEVEPPPLPGCICRAWREPYLDDYWQNLGQMYLTVMGVAGVGLALAFPPLVGLVVSLGLGTLGALITATTVGWRCEDCRRWIARRGLDRDQRRDARLRSLVFWAITGVLAVAFAISFRELQHELARLDAADRALERLQDLGP